MIARVREFARRPLRELPAGLVLAACGLVIVIGALLLARIGEPESPPRAPAAPTGERGSYEVTNPPSSGWDDGYYELPSTDAPEPDSVAAGTRARVRGAARRFLVGYLRYSAGRGAAADIIGATRELLARLEHDPPRQPPGARRRRPRVMRVRLQEAGADEAAAAALIDDTISRYLLRLELVRTGPQAWSVRDVGPG